MNCKNCGAEITEGKAFCGECGTSVNGEVNTNVQNNTVVNGQTTTNTNEGWSPKVYKILSYIGILWLVGMLGKRKTDPSVRFHVGQGIMVTITAVALSIIVAIINNLVIANIFATSYWGIKVVSGTGLAIMGFLNFAVSGVSIALEIIGIVNAANGKDKELPVIGSHAFYK